MSLAFALEKQVAVSAVLRACSLTTSIFNKLVKDEALTKDDKSPVTVGDYAAQAVVNTILSRAFPDDKIVGEEDSSSISGPKEQGLRSRIVDLANEALTKDLALGDQDQWGIGPGQARNEKELLDAIDRGNYEGGRTGRMWTLDPIDGTKGFLRGEQYAVCLALIVDAEVKVGVMGCPNLPCEASAPDGQRGCLFVAVRDQGAEQRTLTNSRPLPLRIPEIAIPSREMNFLESVEAAHAALGFNARVAEILKITRPPTRMDSQAKYGALARGDGGAYVRMPVGTGYQEKIWDHAVGALLVEEAGGVISDSLGKPLDFGLGRTLGENYGVIAAGRSVHGKVLAAIQQAKEEESAEGKGKAKGPSF